VKPAVLCEAVRDELLVDGSAAAPHLFGWKAYDRKALRWGELPHSRADDVACSRWATQMKSAPCLLRRCWISLILAGVDLSALPWHASGAQCQWVNALAVAFCVAAAPHRQVASPCFASSILEALLVSVVVVVQITGGTE
jgi:hypothetical protein